MAKKIVVSKPGYNALTETDPNNLIFSSDYNTLKYYASGYVDVAYSEDTDDVLTYYSGQIAHGLGYIPFFYVYVDVDGSGTFRPCPKIYAAMFFVQSFYSWVDSTNIKFICQMQGDSGSNKTARFRYFIFRNNLNL